MSVPCNWVPSLVYDVTHFSCGRSQSQQPRRNCRPRPGFKTKRFKTLRSNFKTASKLLKQTLITLIKWQWPPPGHLYINIHVRWHLGNFPLQEMPHKHKFQQCNSPLCRREVSVLSLGQSPWVWNYMLSYTAHTRPAWGRPCVGICIKSEGHLWYLTSCLTAICKTMTWNKIQSKVWWFEYHHLLLQRPQQGNTAVIQLH